jgi:chaperonin cofactor prefoldin
VRIAFHPCFFLFSASHGGKKDWKAAMEDAKECIKLNPAFIKGYYRLVTAQMELQDFDAAISTVKQGLTVDPDNSQLLKQLRLCKQKKAAVDSANKRTATRAASSNQQRRGVPMDASVSQEVQDLQEQLMATNREYQTVKANMTRSQREQAISKVTMSEMDKLPADSASKLYRPIGKMFQLSSRADVMTHLDETVEAQSKAESDLTQKLEYLERRMKSQQQNIQELTTAPSSTE